MIRLRNIVIISLSSIVMTKLSSVVMIRLRSVVMIMLRSIVMDGFRWLQHFYAVYDTTNARVGITKTPFTGAETN